VTAASSAAAHRTPVGSGPPARDLSSAGMSASRDVFRRNPRVEYRALDDEGGVLLHVDTAAYHGLNDIGALIWELLDGVTVDNLVARLKEHLLNAPPALPAEVAEFVAQLTERNLVLREPGADQ